MDAIAQATAGDRNRSMWRIGLFSLTAGLALLNCARADSYAPFRNFREVDATGTYYLVVTKREGTPDDPGRGTSVDFTLAERRPSSDAVTVAADSFGESFDDAVSNPEVAVREGDTVLGQGTLDRCPSYLLISTTGLGFVGLDVRGYNYGAVNSPDAFIYVAANGKVELRKSMQDLFGNMAGFQRTAGGIFWCGGGWIDEARSEAIVVGRGRDGGAARPRQFRIVDLKTGDVRPGSADVLTTALEERNSSAAMLALELTAELRVEAAQKYLPWFLTDEQPSMEVRVRAAVALAVLGDRQGAEVISKAAQEDGSWQDYALLNLPVVLGDAAAPILCEAVRSHESNALYATFGMRQVDDEAAVQALIPMLLDASCPHGQDFAIEGLGDKGRAAADAVPHLVQFLAEPPQTREPLWTQTLAVMALGRIGPPAAEAIAALQQFEQQNRARILRLKEDRRAHPVETLFDDEMYDAESLGEKIAQALDRIQADP